jgi:Flp pilus assembly protein TadG
MTTEQQDETATAPRRRRRFLRSFIKNRDGATVVEFALLAMPFSLLIFAILESCLSFAAEEYMQNVTDDFARQFRTGAIRPDKYTQAQFKDEFCKELQAFVGKNCPGLSIDLRNFATFEDAAKLRTQVSNQGVVALTGGFKYEPGPSQSKNVLRVFYAWPVMTDVLRKRMSTLSDNKTLHFATATWQNEPFDD